MEDKLLDKYEKIKALAERGSTDGERKAASSKLNAMKEQNPGIQAAWEAREAKRKAPAAAAPPPARTKPRPQPVKKAKMRNVPPAPDDDSPWWHRDSASEWLHSAESAFRTASTVAQGLGDFASRFTSGVSPIELAANGQVRSYRAQNGAYHMSFTLPEAPVQLLATLTPMQRAIFKRQVLAEMEEHLNLLLPS